MYYILILGIICILYDSLKGKLRWPKTLMGKFMIVVGAMVAVEAGLILRICYLNYFKIETWYHTPMVILSIIISLCLVFAAITVPTIIIEES